MAVDLVGVATWLPALMRSAGYPLGAELSFLVTLYLGGAVGALVGAGPSRQLFAFAAPAVLGALLIASVLRRSDRPSTTDTGAGWSVRYKGREIRR